MPALTPVSLPLLAMVAMLAWPAGGQEPAKPAVDRLLVCNKADHSLSIYDPATRRELAVVPTGKAPHEVAVSPNGRIAVVSDYGAEVPGHTLTVIDVLAAKVVRTIELGDRVEDTDGKPRQRTFLRPHGSAFLDAGHVLVTCERSRLLLCVDIDKGCVEKVRDTPQTTMHMVALSPDHRAAYATSIREGNVAIFDLAGEHAPILVPTGEGAEGLGVDPATGEAWIANRAAHSCSVVDGATHKVLAELQTGELPFRVTFANGGALALISCAESGEIDVFDGKSRKRQRAISISRDGSEQSPLPMGITVDPDGRFAYVACGRGEFIAVLDLRENKVTDRIVSRAGPDGIGYARIVTAK